MSQVLFKRPDSAGLSANADGSESHDSNAILRGPMRTAWLIAGALCLALGTVGVVVPLLPTVDFYVMAAWCFSRGSRRWESWLLNHPRIGPLVRDWRVNRAVPLRIKCLATLSMTASCVWALSALPLKTGWIPAAVCVPVACYLWTRPTRADRFEKRGTTASISTV